MREEPPSPSLISSFRVIYKMERDRVWCLTEIILQRGWNFFFLMRPYHLRWASTELPENLETRMVPQRFNYLKTKILWRAEWTVNSLVRCVTRNGWSANSINFHSSIQYTKSKHFLNCLTFCLFAEYVHIASSTTLSTQAPCQNHRISRN